MCVMCEKRVSKVWKTKETGGGESFVHLQCSSGKLSPEIRAKKICLEAGQEHFLPGIIYFYHTCWAKPIKAVSLKIQQIAAPYAKLNRSQVWNV